MQHIEKAKGIMKENFMSLPDVDLAYLTQGTKEFNHYIKDLLWAQQYASYNRRIIMDLVLKTISFHLYHEEQDLLRLSPFVVNCHHNYSQQEMHFGKIICSNIYITTSADFREKVVKTITFNSKVFA